MGFTERDRLKKRFWELQEPDYDAYANAIRMLLNAVPRINKQRFWAQVDTSRHGYSDAISRLLDRVSIKELREIVRDREGSDDFGCVCR